MSLTDTLKKNVKRKAQQNQNGGSPYFGGGSYPDFFAEFEAIMALPEIDVEGLVSEMAGINRRTFAENAPLAREFGSQIAADAFDDFEVFLERVLPGASDMTRQVARTAQEFITRGVPAAVMGNAMLRDAQMFSATGTRGEVAVRRSLANEAERTTAGVQYGVGLAQQLVNDARGVATGFANLGAQATMNAQGMLTELTSITPGQRIGFAFDERNYQTGVEQFNATGQFNEGQFNAQMGFNLMQFDAEQQYRAMALREQERQRRDASRAALFSTIGTVGGAVLGSFGGPAGAMMGAQIGGGLGQMVGGQQTGNTALMTQGLGTMAGGYTTYQTQQAQNSLMNYQAQSLAAQTRQANAMVDFNNRFASRYGLAPTGPGPYASGYGAGAPPAFSWSPAGGVP